MAQLRFEPILNIGAWVAEFQDAVRAEFPGYEQAEVQLHHVDVGSGSVHSRNMKQHRFVARATPSVAILDEQSVAVEFRAHEQRDQLFRDWKLVFAALTDACKSIAPTRLGLRYVNVIDKQRIASDLGRPVEWPDVVATDFLRLPAELADLEGTRFGMELASSMPLGAMTLRYGLLPTVTGSIAFRYDIDRYRESPMPLDEVYSNLGLFADDVYRAFAPIQTPVLTEWMQRT